MKVKLSVEFTKSEFGKIMTDVLAKDLGSSAQVEFHGLNVHEPLKGETGETMYVIHLSCNQECK